MANNGKGITPYVTIKVFENNYKKYDKNCVVNYVEKYQDDKGNSVYGHTFALWIKNEEVQDQIKPNTIFKVVEIQSVRFTTKYYKDSTGNNKNVDVCNLNCIVEITEVGADVPNQVSNQNQAKQQDNNTAFQFQDYANESDIDIDDVELPF